MGMNYLILLFLNFQLYGESAITHFITAVCRCGSCKITDVHYASRSGSCRGLADDTALSIKTVIKNSQISYLMNSSLERLPLWLSVKSQICNLCLFLFL